MSRRRRITADRDDLMRRFWSNVRRGTQDECWEWQGAIHSSGYGQLYGLGTTFVAH